MIYISCSRLRLNNLRGMRKENFIITVIVECKSPTYKTLTEYVMGYIFVGMKIFYCMHSTIEIAIT